MSTRTLSFIGAAAVLLAASTVTFAGGCSASSESYTYAKADGHKMAKAKANIVQTADAAGQFNTLLAAAKAAGLAETLAGDGPFTVFAPTDAAFDKLPDGTVEHLLKNPEQLKQILLLHVVPGKQTAANVVKASALNTAYGQPIYVKTANNSVTVDGAKVTATDVYASNGVIHVIDEVILPKNIAQIAMADERFSTLLAAVKAAQLVAPLQGESPLTVLAPTNAAFDKLPDGTVASLLEPANRDKLAAVLKYHIASGKVTSDQVVKLDAVPTLQGQTVNVTVKKSGQKATVMLNDATVVIADIHATNGVIHVIDAVLIPE